MNTKILVAIVIAIVIIITIAVVAFTSGKKSSSAVATIPAATIPAATAPAAITPEEFDAERAAAAKAAAAAAFAANAAATKSNINNITANMYKNAVSYYTGMNNKNMIAPSMQMCESNLLNTTETNFDNNLHNAYLFCTDNYTYDTIYKTILANSTYQFAPCNSPTYYKKIAADLSAMSPSDYENAIRNDANITQCYPSSEIWPQPNPNSISLIFQSKD